MTTPEANHMNPDLTALFMGIVSYAWSQRVVIDYTNHRGERGERVIIPLDIHWSEGSRWHPEPQWVLDAIDVAKAAGRTLAMSGIHSWSKPTETA